MGVFILVSPPCLKQLFVVSFYLHMAFSRNLKQLLGLVQFLRELRNLKILDLQLSLSVFEHELIVERQIFRADYDVVYFLSDTSKLLNLFWCILCLLALKVNLRLLDNSHEEGF